MRRRGGFDYGRRDRPVYDYPPFLPRIAPVVWGPVPYLPGPDTYHPDLGLSDIFGFVYLLDDDGAYLVDDDGAFLVEAA